MILPGDGAEAEHINAHAGAVTGITEVRDSTYFDEGF
jgi:hypothetical protein